MVGEEREDDWGEERPEGLDHPFQVGGCGVGEKSLQMGEDAGAAFFGRAVAEGNTAAVHGFGGAVARHAPAVALAAARNLVFKVGDADVGGHFEAGDEGVAGGAVVALGPASTVAV